jgi:hypothetical protein
MFEMQNGTINFDNDRLASLSYNPLLSNTNQQRKLYNERLRSRFVFFR